MAGLVMAARRGKSFRDWRPAAGSGEIFDEIAQQARRHEDWLNLSAGF
jgi:hypothetical protein